MAKKSIENLKKSIESKKQQINKLKNEIDRLNKEVADRESEELKNYLSSKGLTMNDVYEILDNSTKTITTLPKD